MKKTILAIAAVMLLTAASAQDTIHTTQPPENYYHMFWNHYQPGDSLYFSGQDYDANHYNGQVVWCPSSTSLTIYGIAVGLIVKYPDTSYTNVYFDSVSGTIAHEDPAGYYDHNGVYHVVGDSALDESYMDFIIMQVDDKFVVPASDTVRLHLMYDTVSYYLDRGFINLFYAHWHPDPSCKILSVYEKYFDHPVTLHKKFYMGGINHSSMKHPITGDYMYPRIFIEGWGAPGDVVPTGSVICWDSTDWEEFAGNYWEWFFPILTPDPNGDTTGYTPTDSTQTGDTTQTSIQLASWERYVSLQPNPATDEVTVLSSFGMTQVELFDMAGNSVLVQDATGLSAKLDVNTLPRGSYIVRIITPMGVTSRKLILK